VSNDGSVTYELREGVAWLGLNRPHKRNAISHALLFELEAVVRRVQDEARALVVFGHGPCFSAGLDLAEHRAKSENACPAHVEPLQARIKRRQAEYDAPSVHCLDVPSHCDLRDGGVDVAPRQQEEILRIVDAARPNQWV
jgi:enoyl-CoA hydratase/carnithine racemase